MGKKTVYGRIIIDVVDIDGKEQHYDIPCYSSTRWRNRFYDENERYKKLKRDGEVITYTVTAVR